MPAWDWNQERSNPTWPGIGPLSAPSPIVLQWEYETTKRWRRVLAGTWNRIRRPLRLVLFFAFAFALGMYAASAPGSPLANLETRYLLEKAEAKAKSREGELELARIELARLHTIMDYSARYQIPADLAASIYDIALAEGIDPGLAYRLVRTESGFVGKAVSPKGAVGLTQVMPSTAYGMEPGLRYADLFDRETNLRLGFRFLRQMLEKYQGDLRLALLAYNRGPARVDSIRSRGGDPENGYTKAVIGSD